MGGTGCHDRGTGGLHSAGGHASEHFVKAFAHETKGADRSAWSVDCPKAEVMEVGAKRGFKESGLRGAWTGDFSDGCRIPDGRENAPRTRFGPDDWHRRKTLARRA